MKKILLTKGLVALIDDEDFAEISKYKWYAAKYVNSKTYYARRRNRKRKMIEMHREIMKAKRGMKIDHINRNGLDNRRCNLRFTDDNGNAQNVGIPKHNTSGYLGVSWKKQLGKWQASIRVNGKSKYLGYYRNQIEAAKAYDQAAIKYHGEFATTNAQLLKWNE